MAHLLSTGLSLLTFTPPTTDVSQHLVLSGRSFSCLHGQGLPDNPKAGVSTSSTWPSWPFHYWQSVERQFSPALTSIDFVLDLLDMPSKYAWETYAEWGRKYGPLTYLNAAGQPILVINGQEAATELLDNRSAIYSDRPHLVMATELSGKLVDLSPVASLLTSSLGYQVTMYPPLYYRMAQRMQCFESYLLKPCILVWFRRSSHPYKRGSCISS